MVRVLALRFIYDKKSTSPSPMGEDVSLTMALALSEGHKSTGASLRSLSKVTFPFWIVQTSADSSLLLSAFGSGFKKIETTDIANLAEIRRIISSEITSPDSIPDAVDRILNLMEHKKTSETRLDHVEHPDNLKLVTQYIVERDPNISPNRITELLDSQKVLDMSAIYQKLRDFQVTKIESIESLKELITEKMQGHLDVLENRISLEKQQWQRRVNALEERIQQKVQELGSKTSDEIFGLKEKHKIAMRAVTADFSRAMSDVEQFFIDIIEEIRKTRTSIHEKGEDVEGAISDFNDLFNYISDTAPKYIEVLNKISGTSESVKKKHEDAQSGLEESSAEAKSMESVQSSELEKQRDELVKERDEKIKELDQLQDQVNNSITRLRRSVQELLLKLQQKLLEINSFALENDAISTLAPLTRLDVDVFVAGYDNDTFIIFTPGFMPEDRIMTSFRHLPLNNDFDLYITKTIDELIESSIGFEDAFNKSCIEGNILTNPDSLASLRSGLTKLQMTQLLEEGADEKFEELWSKSSGQCPKCGNMAGVGAKFCPGCGSNL